MPRELRPYRYQPYFKRPNPSFMAQMIPMIATAVRYANSRPATQRRRRGVGTKYVGAPIRKKSYRYKSKKLSIADKALKVSPSKFITQEKADRFSSPLGRQEFNVVNTNLDDSQFSRILEAEGKTFGASDIYKMYISSVKNTVTVRNAANVQTILYMYHVVPKHRQTTPFLTDLDNGDNQLQTDDAVANRVFYTNISSNPFDYPKVYMNWRKLKTEKIVLQAGEVRTFEIYRPINKSFTSTNLNLLAPTSTPGQFFPGFSSQIIFRAHGTPVNDSDNENVISASSTRLEYFSTTKVWYKIVDGGQPTSQATDKLTTSFSGPQETMLEATDTKANVGTS